MGPDYPEGSLSPTPEQPPPANLKTTMQEMMRKLEEKNQEFGGELLVTFGQKEYKTLILRNPITRTLGQDGERESAVDEFLAVTEGGFKLIQIDSAQAGGDRIKEFLNKHLRPDAKQYYTDTRVGDLMVGYNSRFGSASAEYLTIGSRDWGTLVIHRDVGVDRIQKYHGRSDLETGRGERTDAVRLISKPDPELVAQIVQLNKERAEELERERKAKESIDHHLEAAKKIDEILNPPTSS